MSKIGKRPIIIKDNVRIISGPNQIIVKGPLGEIKIDLLSKITIQIKDNMVYILRKSNDKQALSLHGLTRALVSNAITGVADGFQKQLELKGAGYRAEAAENKITLHLGYSHPIEFVADESIKFEVKKNIITVFGFDKQKVGQAAAKLRQFRKPDPYKGKGVRYVGEEVKLKPGKAAKTTTA